MLQVLICLVFLAWFDIHSAAAAESAAPKSSDSPGLRLLEEIQTVITDLAESAKPSVVNLIPLSGPGRGRELPQERAPNASGSGSGVIIDPDGHIITNNHVIGDATEIEVRFSDKSKLIAQVVGKDLDTDLAVLKVTADHPLPSAKFGDSSAVRVGQWVLAVGNPFGLDRTVTLGVVSGVGRENINLSRYENFIQTDASINPGNSGGPLFNLRGEIIGINTAIINFAQGIGFAIPSNMAKQVIQQLLSQGRVTRGWLGVGIQDVNSSLAQSFGLERPTGALVSTVESGGPAEKAGIKPGDVILSFNGKPIDSSSQLPPLVAQAKPGSKATVEVWRDGKKQTLNVVVTELKEESVARATPRGGDRGGKLGLAVRPLSPDEKKELGAAQGVMVEEVGGAAARAGIRPGDVITAVNGTPVKSPDELRRQVEKAKGSIALLVRRGDASIFVPIEIG